MLDCRATAADRPAAAVPVLLVATDGGLSDAARAFDGESAGALSRLIASLGPLEKKGGAVERAPTPARFDAPIFAIAVIDRADASAAALERLGGAVAAGLQKVEAPSLWIGAAAGLGLDHADDMVAAALAAGAMARSWRFERYKSEKKAASLETALFAVADQATAEAAFAARRAVAEGAAFTKELVSEPANILYPESFAERCEALRGLGVDVATLGEEEMTALGMNSLLAVGQGSARESKLCSMRWMGAGEGAPVIALVGKGVCFDTGGISLKPAGGMEEMKWDMGGAGAVAGAMKALAGRKAKANVVAVLGLVENMPSGKATRPGDVVTAMSGTTIEVVNTDAEGRMVLADALWWTQENHKPDIVIDLATLTGAAIVALGHEMAVLFANDDDLAQKISAAGEAVGEPAWRMPITKAYRKHIESDIADIKNVGKARQAGATAGAVFLEKFVQDGVKWAHLDIAGVAWAKSDLPLSAKGATGFGARLLDRLIADLYEN